MNGQFIANWYPHPSDPTYVCFWDGSSWTEHVAPSPAPGSPPPPFPTVSQPPPPPPAPAPAPVSQQVPATHPAPFPQPQQGYPEPPLRSRGGVFGSKKALEDELTELRSVIDRFGFSERDALAADVGRLKAEAAGIHQDVGRQRAELDLVSASLVRARDEVILQEVGIYDYHHRLEDSVAYKASLDSLRSEIKAMSRKDGGAVRGSTNWTVEGSTQKGTKMVNDISKLLLRAYNGEADVQVAKMRPYKLEAALDRLNKSRLTVTKLGSTMGIEIDERYHQLRLQELRLTADYLTMKEEEKEAQREERERLREEAKAAREFEQEKAKLLKEQAHYKTALIRLRETGTPEEIAAAEETLAEVGEAIHGVEERAANHRAGYVYVISNVGTFGTGVVKIGMTRRLEPLDRVRELGDASVPFRYDVHALVFSNDAVALETALHQRFAAERVNLVNLRREFFYVAPREVATALQELEGSLLEFVEKPDADEWHQSENARHNLQLHAHPSTEAVGAPPPPPAPPSA